MIIMYSVFKYLQPNVTMTLCMYYSNHHLTLKEALAPSSSLSEYAQVILFVLDNL